jgi:hypothetical protein
LPPHMQISFHYYAKNRGHTKKHRQKDNQISYIY